ncbi:MAG: hypothetical protein AB1861_17300 [Cyanobacteriota bacterium]
MKIKGIKRGQNIELLEIINIPDGSEILISIDDEDNQLIALQSEFWEALENFRQEVDLQETGIEPEIFEGVRDSLPGREVNW